MQIEVDDLSGAQIRALLAAHLADMYATSPACSVHALDLTELRDRAVTVWSASEGDTVLGCVALKQLSPAEGEVKSMRTATEARGRGVGSALLRHLLAQAGDRGYTRVSLETGTQDFFEPARRLYRAHGFVVCDPFADYRPDPNSVYLTREL
jgi:putative acetyltransferase